MKKSIWTCLHLLIYTITESLASVANGTAVLHTTLLENYLVDMRPCLDCDHPLEVAMTLHVTSLNKIDEIEGELNTVGYLKVVWADERLTWDPLKNGIGSIMISSKKIGHSILSKIWTPLLLLGNPSQEISVLNADSVPARVLHNGTVIWYPGDVFRSICAYDVHDYPFDRQDCWIAFTAWSFLASEIRLYAAEDHVKKPFFQENGGWRFGNTSSMTFTSEGLSFVQFNMEFIRRSEFFVVSVILPVFFLSFLDCLSFLIPFESGERVSYTITVLLSLAVFMTLVSDNVPKTSAPMSLLCYFLTSLFAGSVAVMIWVTINMRFFYTDSSLPVSSVYTRIVKIMNYCLRKGQKRHKRTTDNANHSDYNNFYPRNDRLEHVEEDSHTSGRDIEWREVANAFDAIGFFVSFIYYACITSAMILQIKSSGN